MTTLDPTGLEKAAHALDENFNPDRYPVMAAMFTDYARAAVTAYLGHTEVTTVEELDALPVGSVCIDPFDAAGDAPVIICKNALGHWTAMVDPDGGGRYLWAAAEIAAVTKGRLLCIYRPTP